MSSFVALAVVLVAPIDLALCVGTTATPAGSVALASVEVPPSAVDFWLSFDRLSRFIPTGAESYAVLLPERGNAAPLLLRPASAAIAATRAECTPVR